MASTLTSLIPQTPGLLPQWLLFTALVSVGNSVQAYTTLKFTSRVYNPTPIDPPPQTPKHVTALSSRTFGTWTFLASVIRMYAAYNITNAAMYQLAMWAYVVAFGHFMSEWMVFRTSRWGLPLAGPVCISTGTLVWMYTQWDAYVVA
ncbi:ergosterol biosynthesis protein-like protein [Phaeosphaeria sp. MPI-PUGE-AT-0046c]|nr:ergosterol biosynthesis protein-like protein [Phaeosphaeria sp. MPI-PUGE-AT-0046c]